MNVLAWKLESIEPQKAALTRGPLSPSQVSTYLDCAARWYFGSALSLPDPPNGGLALGRAVHAAIALDLAAHKAGESRSEDDIREGFNGAWLAEMPSTELAPDEDAAALAGKGADLAWLFHRDVTATLKVALIEQPVSGQIGTAHARGIIDIVTQDGELIDIKTAAKKPSGVSSAHKLQLTTYGMLTGSRRARVITITKTKAPEILHHPFEITPSHTQHTATMYSLVGEAIEGGLHIPNRGSNFCSRKHCAFWRACESEFGGQVKE